MNTHYFDSTKEAYDATQCRDDIKQGDALVIASENVVGIAFTWPIAVTKNHGELHTLKDDATLESLDEFTQEQIDEVRNLAGLFDTSAEIEFKQTSITSRALNRRQRNALKRIVRVYREMEHYNGVTSVRFDLVDYEGTIYVTVTTRRSDCGKYSPRAIVCARRAHIKIGDRGGLKTLSAENGMSDERRHIARMIGGK